MATAFTKEQLEQDIAFLAAREANGPHRYFGDSRETGLSSNSIVAIVYGVIPPDQQELPADDADLNACLRMWDKLPAHRKGAKAKYLIGRARNYRAHRGEW